MVYAKLESFQRTSSFKVRGALNAAMSLPKEILEKGVITASSGNHGKALAYAATQLGTKAYVVVPETAPKIKVEGIRSYGADIVFRPEDKVVFFISGGNIGMDQFAKFENMEI